MEEIAAEMMTKGVSEGLAYVSAADMARDHTLIEIGRCPRCGLPMARSKDPRQTGLAEVEGVWFRYRHTPEMPGGPTEWNTIETPILPKRCQYLFDRKEKKRE